MSAILAPPYVPQLVKVFDQGAYEADNAMCASAGAAYKPSFSLMGAATKVVDGATAETSLIPVSPLVPVYGAAGGALSAASNGLDVMSGQHAAVYRNCLRDAVNLDHSAILVDDKP